VRPESELDFGRGPNGSTPAVCYKDVLRAMKKEVNLMENLNHPHVVKVVGTAEDCRVFVMERAVSDLYTIIKQHDSHLPLGHAKREEFLVCDVHLVHVLGRSKRDQNSLPQKHLLAKGLAKGISCWVSICLFDVLYAFCALLHCVQDALCGEFLLMTEAKKHVGTH
jgi:hypothetical protein